MRITEIEYGFTKNLGNDQSERISYRAILEDWENPEESLDLLRDRVMEELNLPGTSAKLREQCDRRIHHLERLRSYTKEEKRKLAEAKEAWEKWVREFLTDHGVDPTTLTIENFSAIKDRHRKNRFPKMGEDDTIESGLGGTDDRYGDDDFCRSDD